MWNPLARRRQSKFDQEWSRLALETALSLGEFRKIGDDWYLTTTVGHTHTHIQGHVWAKLELST